MPILRGVGAVEDAADPPAVHDRDAIAHAEDLRQLRRDHQDGEPALGQLCIRPWISAFAPTSTPCVGSSRISTRRLGRQPARQRDFLLIAARQRPDLGAHRGRLDAQPIDVFAARRRARGRASISPRLRHRGKARQAGVRGNRHLEHDAVLPAVLRHIGDAGADRVGRRRDARPARRRARSCPRRPASARTASRASSVRPDPTRPASPRISPRRTVSETSRMPAAALDRLRTSSTAAPSATGCFGNTADTSRPTISRISSPRSISAAGQRRHASGRRAAR